MAANRRTDHARFAVCDTGIGIPLDRQHSLFREFYRIRHAGGREVEGSGLGLAISKRLVEIIGGSIGVTSREGKGSTFWFEVSLRATAGAPPPKSEPRSVRPGTTGRVLVAEDLPMNQMIIAEMLEKAGHTVRLVGGRIGAIEAVRAETFDAILMDMEMPVMGGLEATRAIRRMAGSPGMPIVALTANAMPEQIAECRKAGMNDFVSKPIDRALLLHTIAKWIVRHPALSSTGDAQPSDIEGRGIFVDLERRFGRDRARRFMAIGRDNIEQVVGLLSECGDSTATAHGLHDLVSVAGNIGLKALSEQSRALMNAIHLGASDTSCLAATVLASARAALALLAAQSLGEPFKESVDA